MSIPFATDLMERTRLIRHRGHDVVLIDLTGTTASEMLAEAANARAVFERLPGDALLTVTDLAGARYDSRALDALKRLAADNTPRVRASAVVSDSAAQRAAVSLVSLFSRRKFQSFGTREEALDWLASQA